MALAPEPFSLPVAERYVRPVLLAREAPPAWLGVWRFRLVAFVAISLLVLVAILLFRQFTGATEQDPGLEAGRVPGTEFRLSAA